MQVKDISSVKGFLEAWKNLDQNSSLIEDMVLFHKHMMFERVLRFQGKFKDSLVHLEWAWTIVEQWKNLLFNKDLCDLTCNLNNTLQELDKPITAKHHLYTEITQQDKKKYSLLDRSLIQLSLVETLFIQGHYKEAER